MPYPADPADPTDPDDPAGTLQARRPRSHGGPAGARRGQEGGRRYFARRALHPETGGSSPVGFPTQGIA